MAEYRSRHAVDVGIQTAENLAAFVRDCHFHDAPVLAAADARDQAKAAQAVDEARDVRIAGDHAVGDLAARQPGRMAAAKNAQDVVLVVREAGGGLEELLPRLHDPFGGDQQAQEDLLLARREGALLLQFTGNDPGHGHGQ
jgi:hypothetical protein